MMVNNKKLKLPPELLAELVKTLRFDLRWARVRVSSVFDYFAIKIQRLWFEEQKKEKEKSTAEIGGVLSNFTKVVNKFEPAQRNVLREVETICSELILHKDKEAFQKVLGAFTSALDSIQNCHRLEIGALRTRISQQDELIARQQQQIAQLRGEIARQQQQIAQLRGEIVRQGGQIAQLRGENTQLRDELRRQIQTVGHQYQRFNPYSRGMHPGNGRGTHFATRPPANAEPPSLAVQFWNTIPAPFPSFSAASVAGSSSQTLLNYHGSNFYNRAGPFPSFSAASVAGSSSQTLSIYHGSTFYNRAGTSSFALQPHSAVSASASSSQSLTPGQPHLPPWHPTGPYNQQ
ncbi:hypothetical protein niasHT_035643 [Heterodera trifolii]|uniref:Uncharacterized protein n=1 Tax=Heterodera trifolii TaxID=157864 RepID=A0ABD2HYI8_9BILA